MRRIRPIAHRGQLSLVEHLDELRARLVVSLAVFGVALALCFWQNHLLLELASGPLPSDHDKLITFGVTEPFTTTRDGQPPTAAIILALPFVLYQLYAYLLPAFSKQQQRMILPLLLLIPVLFIAGRRLRLLRRPPRRGQVPAQLQRLPVQHPGAGEGVLRLLRPDPARLRDRLPGAGRRSSPSPGSASSRSSS